MPYTNEQARHKAVEMVTAALGSKSIPLRGNQSNQGMDAVELGKEDGQYLASLVAELCDQLRTLA